MKIQKFDSREEIKIQEEKNRANLIMKKQVK